MKRLTAWSVPALLLLIVAGCSKDDSNLTGPVASDQEQKVVQASPKSYWEPWPDPEWAKMEPYVKSYPAPTKKSALKRTAAEPPIVTNGDFETKDFSGWTTFVTFPGMVDFSTGTPHPEWAWIVGSSDPRGTNTAIYRTGMLHPEPLAHSGNAGASAVENVGGIVHQLYQTVTLPLGGNLTFEFWVRWKNQYVGTPKWFNNAQDIVVTLKDPVTDAILATLFKASTVQPPPFSGEGNITTADYEKRTADITALAGQTVKLSFETDALGATLFVDLDDISIVQVLTNHPPVANAGPDQSVECTSHSGATVMLDGSASSDADNDPLTYAWTWTGGSASDVKPTVTLPLGSHEITLTVDDGKGATATDVVVVKVVDTTPPVINLNGPSEVTLECPATYTDPVTVSDACDPSPTLTVEGAVDGHMLGTYTLKYTAKDASGNQSTATRTVKVVDTTPPMITLNGANPMTLECPTPYVEPGAVVTDACDPAPKVSITGSVDGSTLGTYLVTYVARDASGNTATATRTVIVQDTKPPVLSYSVSKRALYPIWPANHALINVGLQVNANDACDPYPIITVKVYANEDDEMDTGDGNFSPDAKNFAAGTLELRAERCGGGNGRVYLVVVAATDHSNNMTSQCFTVVVPSDQSASAIAAVEALAAAVMASCGPDGSPLTPYVIGDGPIIGPKQ